MNTGITFDEKILNSRNMEEWLETISQNGATFIELSPHPSILDLKEYQRIANKASNLSMKTAFHVPYFADQKGFQLNWDITERQHILNNHVELFHWIEEWHQPHETAYLVLHAATYSKGHKKSAMDTTLRFLDAFLNQLVSVNQKTVLLVETLSRHDDTAIGNSWDELTKILDTFKTEQLQICWDLCHDLRNHDFQLIHLETLDFCQIPYAHIHGFQEKSKKSHVQILEHKHIFEEAIKQSTKLGFQGMINLETLKGPCGTTYEEVVLGDLQWLKDLFADLK